MHDDTPATILVAEDDATTRTFLADELTADGYELLVTDCCRDALRLLETKYPDLAILDVGLADGSGLELLQRIRAADGLGTRIDPDLPVLLLSGRAAEVDRLRGFARGADDYVAKANRGFHPGPLRPHRVRGCSLERGRAPGLLREPLKMSHARMSRSGAA